MLPAMKASVRKSPTLMKSHQPHVPLSPEEKKATLYSPEVTAAAARDVGSVGRGHQTLPQIGAPPCQDLELKISVAQTVKAEKVTRDAQAGDPWRGGLSFCSLSTAQMAVPEG